MLGPMVNPAFPKNQMVGVFSLELLRLYGYLYQETNKNYAIVHALDGYDEISLTGKTKVVSNNSESLFLPEDIGFSTIGQNEIFGGKSVKMAAEIFKSIINGEGTEAQNNVVFANAGLAIATAKDIDLKEGIELAKESLLSGNAKDSLKTLIAISK